MSTLRDQQRKLTERRTAQMHVFRARGWTMQRIADYYGISKQAVSQQLKRADS